jgi:hypothetical protein
VAYKILVRGRNWDGTDFPVTLDNLCAMHEMLGASSFKKPDLSKDVDIDFIMRRNLEHILSVCSIPNPQSFRHFDKNQESIEHAIALTCGDMSGHRIVTSASL